MNTQWKTPLFEALMEHVKKKPISFHVPGHKYGHIMQTEANALFEQILKIDATELSGLDDLHSPVGAILEAEVLLSELYQIKKSYFLVNGSTVGNLAMIMAACEEGTSVLVQRNCHKSVLNALSLAKVSPVFLEPEYDPNWKVASGISIETVREAIQLYPEAKAIIITYPNYYGMVTELQEIINLAHFHQIPVLVDEAHGPHFIVGSPFPTSAVQLGADIVVQSAHKTLPAMTMGSFLHVNSQFLPASKVEEYLEMFQSSSPSYPIMASLDLARKYIATYEDSDVSFLLTEIRHFKEELSKIPTLTVLDYPNNQGDPLKVTIQSRCGLSGYELQRKFEEVSIYTELADPFNVLFILPLLKKGQCYPLAETVLKIKEVMAELTFHVEKEECQLYSQKVSTLAIPYKEMSDLGTKDIPFTEAKGLICAEAIIPYPPGIPLLLKGERITVARLNQLDWLLKSGARFQGGSVLKRGLLKVFCTT